MAADSSILVVFRGDEIVVLEEGPDMVMKRHPSEEDGPACKKRCCDEFMILLLDLGLPLTVFTIQNTFQAWDPHYIPHPARDFHFLHRNIEKINDNVYGNQNFST